MNELAYIAAVILSGNRNLTPEQAVAAAQQVIEAARQAQSKPEGSGPVRVSDRTRRIDPENVQPMAPEVNHPDGEAPIDQETAGHVVTELQPQPPPPQTVPQEHQPQPLLQQPPQPKHPDAVRRDELLKQGAAQPAVQPETVMPAVHPAEEKK